ncbi:flagellar motor protein MotB [Sphingosinicella sp. CPCC 101087]|uniref:flagellar motor protein MotB n=1 Tax=Sphingosinicella sp. CPCC 101087 TaxID=2497754 RepID=UPI0013ED1016|nr:flagellar motor protein MotB [Sphingosinicella sp. CPCC 101087]
MRSSPAPRWTVSFADLALLLLGSFVMLHALRPPAPPATAAAAAPASGATIEFDARELFEPGEARLNPTGRARLALVARSAAGGRVVLDSSGVEPGGQRLDSFELAAARAAALGRALNAAERDVSASVERIDGEGLGQRIRVRILR